MCLGHLGFELEGDCRHHLYLPLPESGEIMLTRSLFRAPAGPFFVWTCDDTGALDRCLAALDSFYPSETYRRYLERLASEANDFSMISFNRPGLKAARLLPRRNRETGGYLLRRSLVADQPDTFMGLEVREMTPGEEGGLQQGQPLAMFRGQEFAVDDSLEAKIGKAGAAWTAEGINAVELDETGAPAGETRSEMLYRLGGQEAVDRNLLISWPKADA